MMIGDTNPLCDKLVRDHDAGYFVRCGRPAEVERGINVSTGLPQTFCMEHDPESALRERHIKRMRKDARRTLGAAAEY